MKNDEIQEFINSTDDRKLKLFLKKCRIITKQRIAINEICKLLDLDYKLEEVWGECYDKGPCVQCMSPCHYEEIEEQKAIAGGE